MIGENEHMVQKIRQIRNIKEIRSENKRLSQQENSKSERRAGKVSRAEKSLNEPIQSE